MYPKFKEISLDTATWTVAFLGAIEERETKSKKPFCTFHLLDGAIAIIANLWNTEKKDIYKVQEKSVISVQLYKKLYNGVETYEVKEYQAAPDDAKLEDYLLTAPIPSQDMMDEIKSILSKEISETELYPLVMEILDENADKLLYWAAAKTIHHNCYGGLLYHMLRMLKTAVILSRVYRFDKELLYSAVMQSGHFIKPAYAYSWTYSVARYELRNLRVLFCKWKCNCVKCLRKWSFKLYSVA